MDFFSFLSYPAYLPLRTDGRYLLSVQGSLVNRQLEDTWSVSTSKVMSEFPFQPPDLYHVSPAPLPVAQVIHYSHELHRPLKTTVSSQFVLLNPNNTGSLALQRLRTCCIPSQSEHLARLLLDGHSLPNPI